MPHEGTRGRWRREAAAEADASGQRGAVRDSRQKCVGPFVDSVAPGER